MKVFCNPEASRQYALISRCPQAYILNHSSFITLLPFKTRANQLVT